MRTGTVLSAAMHATALALVLLGDRLFPAPSRARVIEIPQVDLISGIDFDAALSQVPEVPEQGLQPPPAPQVAPETTPPPASPESTASLAPPPVRQPSPPPPPEARVDTETAPDAEAEAAPAPAAPTPAQPPLAAPPTSPEPPRAAPPVPRSQPASRPTPVAPSQPARADTAPPPAPEPDPVPAPAPAPDPAPVREATPEPAPQPAPSAPAVAAAPPNAPVPTARPPRRPVPAPEPERATPATPPAPNPIDALVEQAQRQAPAAAPEAGAGTSNRPLSGTARNGLIAGIRQHFVPPEGIAGAATLSVTFEFPLSRNGRLMERPTRVAPAGALDPAHRALEIRALRALLQAAETGVFATLPPESYDTWRRMRVTFTPEDLTL